MAKKLLSLKRPTVKSIAWGKPASRKKSSAVRDTPSLSALKPSPKPRAKLLHLEHAEDHMISHGIVGYLHACETLFAVHDALLGKPSRIFAVVLRNEVMHLWTMESAILE